jgi:hypothetical protein
MYRTAQGAHPYQRRQSVDVFFARLASDEDQKLASFAGPLLARFLVTREGTQIHS